MMLELKPRSPTEVSNAMRFSTITQIPGLIPASMDQPLLRVFFMSSPSSVCEMP